MEEHHHQVASAVIKGKRIKRQKPLSPVPFEVIADDPPATIMTTTGNNIDFFSSTTEEEEDMANCLILLAQGQSMVSSPDNISDTIVNHNKTTTTVYNNIIKDHMEENYYPQQQQQQQQQQQSAVKYNSKKYLEAATTTAGNKAGYYVYQCKTCNRTFPSFQALGGHRASHKKTKVGGGDNSQFLFHHVQDKKQQSSPSVINEDGSGSYFRKIPALSLQLSRNNSMSSTNKVHECSICGAEFMSGQALGGHMRRHRAAPAIHHIGSHTNNIVKNSNNSAITVGNANTTLSLTPLIDKLELETEEQQPTASKGSLSLDLDLNLPARGQDQEMAPYENSNKLQQIDNQQKTTSNNNQPSSSSSVNVFSATPTLVDCHY